MRSFGLSQLLFCVAALCSRGTTGFYSHLHKRQADYQRCYELELRESCRLIGQEQATIALQCGLDENAAGARDICLGVVDIDIDLPVRRDFTCDETNFLQQIYRRTICTRTYTEPIREVLTDNGCEDNDILGVCVANEAGQYCIALNDVYNDVDKVNEVCNNTNMCEPSCTEALSILNDEYGCCLNNLFNTTDTAYFSFVLWSQCGLTPPGICGPRLTNQAPTLNAPWKTMGIAATLCMIALVMLRH